MHITTDVVRPAAVEVLERHAFSSELQRMCTVADVSFQGTSARCALVRAPAGINQLRR